MVKARLRRILTCNAGQNTATGQRTDRGAIRILVRGLDKIAHTGAMTMIIPTTSTPAVAAQSVTRTMNTGLEQELATHVCSYSIFIYE